jgi:hypothetical protein
MCSVQIVRAAVPHRALATSPPILGRGDAETDGGSRHRGKHSTRLHRAIANLWEQPMTVGGSFGGANRFGEGHDKISTDRSSGGLVAGRSYDSHGSKWSAHWRISTSTVEPEFLWLLRLPSSPLWLPSSLLRLLSSPLPSSSLVSLLKETLRPPRAAFFFTS